MLIYDNIVLQKELFEKVLITAGKTNVKNMKVDISDLEHYEQMYIDALKSLKTESIVSIIYF